MRILIASVMLLFSLVSVEPAFSHSARTDASGGHESTSDYRYRDENDDDFGCAIAGFEETPEASH